ncbi:MAG: DMT family transporter [Verrucomicrobiales bacterium]|nr:DMT family transporter [Verrucomicrobiales bacterium]
MPWYLLIPFFCAAIYSLSTLFLKRAMHDGAPPLYSFHITNLIVGVCFLPLILLEKQDIAWHLIHQPLIAGVAFFIGSWFTFIAIHRGDVSLVTPLMGAKVIFVALLAAALTSRALSTPLILASLLSAIGIAVMGAKDFAHSKHAALTVGLALSRAAVFALCDVLVGKWAPGFGPMAFLTLSTIGLAIVSLIALIIMAKKSRSWQPSAPTRAWVIYSALMVAGQAIGMGYILSTNSDTTGINVIYGARGLWVIILIAAIGPLLGNKERQLAKHVFLYRFIGTLLLSAAIVLAVIAGKQS